MKLSPWWMIALIWPGLAGAGEEAAPAFLQRDGARLMMESRPFRAVGVNKHELLDLYLADLLDGDGAASRAQARASLDALQAIGVDVIRVRGSQFWPAQIERTYLGDDAARAVFWQRYDEMLADCRARGIKVVLTIAWHLGAWPDLGHESLRDFVNRPDSASRRLFDQWVRDLVTRYRDDESVLFWELTNEANLGVDLRPQIPEGIIPPQDLSRPHAHLVAGPVVRDERNHWSADELAAFTRETAALIKSIDPHHLVGTGFSAPRPAAWHLWLGSLRRAQTMDWTADDEEEQANYLRLLTPEPVDLVSVHDYFGPDPDLGQIALIRRVANELGKPVYLGETGMSPAAYPGAVYAHPAAVEALGELLAALAALDLPLILLWTWDENTDPVHEPVIRPAENPEVTTLLRAAQARAKGR